MKKPVSQAQPGDQVEIITKPDGTKVRRIRRAKNPETSDSNASQNGSLGTFLGSGTGSKAGSSATVAGDYAEGEIYIRADGKKYVLKVVFVVLFRFTCSFDSFCRLQSS